MFDIGFFELALIGVVALLVLGPERLPRAARLAGLWVRRARASWYALRSDLERELADEDLKRSLKESAQQLGEIRQSLAQDARDIATALPAAPAAIASPPAAGDSASTSAERPKPEASA